MSSRELSGVVMRITSASSASAVRKDLGFPAPMKRTAARALAEDLVTTAPIRQPRSRRRLAMVWPTRPAPMMETVRDIERDSIACSIHVRWEKFDFALVPNRPRACYGTLLDFEWNRHGRGCREAAGDSRDHPGYL